MLYLSTMENHHSYDGHYKQAPSGFFTRFWKLWKDCRACSHATFFFLFSHSTESMLKWFVCSALYAPRFSDIYSFHVTCYSLLFFYGIIKKIYFLAEVERKKMNAEDKRNESHVSECHIQVLLFSSILLFLTVQKYQQNTKNAIVCMAGFISNVSGTIF